VLGAGQTFGPIECRSRLGGSSFTSTAGAIVIN